MLNENTLRKYFRIIIRIHDSYPELNHLELKYSKKLMKVEIIGEYDLDNLVTILNQLNYIIYEHSEIRSL